MVDQVIAMLGHQPEGPPHPSRAFITLVNILRFFITVTGVFGVTLYIDFNFVNWYEGLAFLVGVGLANVIYDVQTGWNKAKRRHHLTNSPS